MPKYAVYNTQTGEIVHLHETYEATGGTSLISTRDEVLALVDDRLQKDDLDIVEIEVERQSGSVAEAEVLRVDPKTRTLVTRASE
jgi:hypothetical protein